MTHKCTEDEICFIGTSSSLNCYKLFMRNRYSGLKKSKIGLEFTLIVRSRQTQIRQQNHKQKIPLIHRNFHFLQTGTQLLLKHTVAAV